MIVKPQPGRKQVRATVHPPPSGNEPELDEADEADECGRPRDRAEIPDEIRAPGTEEDAPKQVEQGEQEKHAEILGRGPEAAPRAAEVLANLGLVP